MTSGWTFLLVTAVFWAACSSDDVSGRSAPGPGGTRDASITVPFDDASRAETSVEIVDGSGLVNDSAPAVDAKACAPGMSDQTPGPYVRRCAAPTDNECNGKSDVNPQWPNGQFGNGFDDDCDGKVDEGCQCDGAHPVGTTKACSLVSSSQVDPMTKQPVGWCAGTLSDCVIAPIHSTKPKADKDGSNAFCVDTNPMNGPAPAPLQDQWKFTATGGYPVDANGFCWH